MEKDNTKQLQIIAKMLNPDRFITADDISAIRDAVFTLLSNFKKGNEELNAETKKEVEDILKVVSIRQKELYEDIKDGKKEMSALHKEQIEEIKYLAKEIKKMKPKPGAKGKDADEEKIIGRIYAMIEANKNQTDVESKDDHKITGEQVVDMINDLDYTSENLIDIKRIKGWKKFFDNKNSNKAKGFQPTVLTNAMDLDTSARANGYAIVWDEVTGMHKYAASGGGGGGSGTVNSGTEYRLAYYATTGTAVSQASAITGARVLVSDTNGVPTHSSITTTTLGYLDATSSIQTQLNAKGTFTLPSLTAGSVLFSNGTTIVENNSKLYWDNINFRLGINTTSPLYSLEVKGGNIYNNSTGTGFFITNRGANTNFSGFQFNTNQVAQWTIGSRNDSTENLYFFAEVSGAIRATLTTAGLLGVGIAPTAVLTLKAGTATASTAPLKFTSGVNLTTAEAGAMEYDGTWAYFTLSGTTRRKFVFADTIQTITNKRNQPRVYTATNNASLTPEIDTYDVFHLTAMSANTTINNKSTSTPSDGEQMRFRFLDNGTSRTLSWGTDYVAKAGVALPTATTISKNLIVLFEWNANLSKWNCLASGLEA